MVHVVNEQEDIADLVRAAAVGNQQAWNSIVDRYLPLVVSITRRFRLSFADSEDVSQSLWLKLVGHIQQIREPRALPGWISTTTRNLCLHVISCHQRENAIDVSLATLERSVGDRGLLDEELLRLEQRQAIRDGLEELNTESKELLLMLVQEPPLSYREISSALGIPMGSIGPTRARCLQKLRQTAALRNYLGSGTASVATPDNALVVAGDR